MFLSSLARSWIAFTVAIATVLHKVRVVLTHSNCFNKMICMVHGRKWLKKKKNEHETKNMERFRDKIKFVVQSKCVT